MDLLLGGHHGEALAPLPTARGDDLAASRRGHACTEAVLVLTLPIAGLVRALHGSSTADGPRLRLQKGGDSNHVAALSVKEKGSHLQVAEIVERSSPFRSVVGEAEGDVALWRRISAPISRGSHRGVATSPKRVLADAAEALLPLLMVRVAASSGPAPATEKRSRAGPRGCAID